VTPSARPGLGVTLDRSLLEPRYQSPTLPSA
jgi:hypothetical protein